MHGDVFSPLFLFQLRSSILVAFKSHFVGIKYDFVYDEIVIKCYQCRQRQAKEKVKQ